MAADGDTRSTFGSILAIAGGIVVAIATQNPGAGYGVYAAIIGLSVVGGVLQYTGARISAKEAAERARQANNSQAFKSNISGGAEHHFMVFGEARVGGIVVAAGTSGTNGEFLHLGIAHSLTHAGGCEGVSGVWLGDTKIIAAEFNLASGIYTANTAPFAGFVAFEHHKGIGTGVNIQLADAVLQAAGIDPADVAGSPTLSPYRRGIAWTRFKLTRDMASDENFRKAFPRGIPTLTVKLKGIKVYDPRLDSTNGGSGSHRVADPTTWQWTGGGGSSSDVGRNPALCAATYMIMLESDGGMGYASSRINWASVAAAATICEEDINPPSGVQRKYRCDGVLSTADKRSTNLEHILASMQGVVVRVGTQFYMYAGAYEAVGFTITEDWLRGPVSHATKDPIESLYNSVRVSMDRATNDYRPDEIPAFLGANESSNYETQDGGQRLWQDVNLRMVSDLYNAEYIAAIRGRRSRLQSSLELPLNLRGLQLKVWDTVTVTLPEIGASQVFRVVGWTWEDNGPKVSLREEAADIYVPGTVTWATVTAAGNLVETVLLPAPTGVTATAVADGIIVTFTPPSLSLVHVIEIWRSTTSGGTYTKIATVSPGNTQYKDPITNGATYFYKVRAMTAKYQAGTDSSIVTATAKTVANGADVTAEVAQNTILNPGFEAGDVDWEKATSNWTILEDISACRTGEWYARWVGTPGTGSTGAQITNSFVLGVAAGNAVVGHAFIEYAAGSGSAYLRIVFYNDDLGQGSEVGSPLAGDVINSGSPGGYRQSRVWGVAPAGAKSCKVQVLTSDASRNSTFYVDDFYMALMVQTVDELVDGTDRGAVDTGFLNDDNEPLIDLSDPDHINKSIDALAVGTYAYILYSQLTTDTFAHRLTASEAADVALRIGNLFNLIGIANIASEVVVAQSGNLNAVLTATDAGSTASISVNAFYRKLGAQTVNYAAQSNIGTGLAFSTKYVVYCNDASYAGGSPTMVAAIASPGSDVTNAFAGTDGRFVVGYITTPADGAANTGQSGGGGSHGGDCVDADSWITGTRRARDMRPGDAIRCRTDRGEFLTAPIEGLEFVTQHCVKVITDGGAELICSQTTPFTLKQGGSITVMAMEGEHVLVQRGLNRVWEKVISVTGVGEKQVARIHVGGRSYPAGALPHALIYSHNPVKP